MGNLLFWLGIGAAQKGAGIEAAWSTDPGSLASRRYSGCPVDCGWNVYSVGQPEI